MLIDWRPLELRESRLCGFSSLTKRYAILKYLFNRLLADQEFTWQSHGLKDSLSCPTKDGLSADSKIFSSLALCQDFLISPFICYSGAFLLDRLSSDLCCSVRNLLMNPILLRTGR